MSTSATNCPHCGLSVKQKSRSEHKRQCTKIIFTIHQNPLAKTGPTTLIQRRPEDDYIVCHCISPEGELCDQAVKNEKQLMRHLRANGHKWNVSDFF